MAGITIVILLAFVWFLQLLLSTWQTKKFHQRVFHLRKKGKYTAVGMSGRRFSGRTYVVLVVDESGRVCAVEQLGGVTVFSRLRSVSNVVGMHLDDLEASTHPEIRPKLWKALQHARGFIVRKLLEEEETEDSDS